MKINTTQSMTPAISDVKVGRIKQFKNKTIEKISNLINKIFSDKKSETVVAPSNLSDRQVKQMDSSSSPLPANVTSIVDHQHIIKEVDAVVAKQELELIKVNEPLPALEEMLELSPNLVATMLYNKGLPSAVNAKNLENAENQETKKERILATLNEINHYIQEEKTIPHYEHKKKIYDEHGELITENRYVKEINGQQTKAKCSSYSWFIDEKKQVFIVNEKIAKGGVKRIHQGFCLNNFESVAVISSDVKYYREPEVAIQKNMENTQLLNKLGVPNLAESPVYRAMAEVWTRPGTEGGGARSTYTQTLFDGDAYAIVPEEKRKSLEDSEKKQILKFSTAMLNSLAQIHKKGYVHLDVKPHNFITHKGEVYLSDFDGLSKAGSLFDLDIHIITSYYRPPELAGNSKIKLSPSQDSYEMGVSMINFFFGMVGKDKRGFSRTKVAKDPVLAKKTVRAELKKLGIKGKELNTLVNVMSGLIHPNPKKRMSCEKAAKLMKRLNF